ncbi:MAG: ABC transporter ATP-binding protein [Anaerolineales bacterium]
MDKVNAPDRGEETPPKEAPPTPPTGPPTTNGVSDAVVRAEGLTKQFGEEFAVREVDLEVPRGAIFGFIGPSGSGKTTTIRLLTGIAQPTAGHATVLGTRPSEFPAALRERLGYMPQSFVLYPDLSVWENLNFAASLYGMGWGRGKRMKELLDFVELTEHRHKLARQLSGGMQRRLSLAATLVHDPELMFLDEPTAGIDPMLRRKFWDYFRELQGRGRTLFITTQYVGEAAYCDLVGVMAEGRLLLVETPENLRRRAMGGEVIDIQLRDPISIEQKVQLERFPFIQGSVTTLGPNHFRIVVDEASTAMPTVLEWCQTNNVAVESIEEFQPPFDDVFVELIHRET